MSNTEIINYVRGVFDVDVFKKTNLPQYSHARWLCYYIMKSFGRSINEIAKYFGKHHTTVMYGLEKIEQTRDRNIRKALKEADSMIENKIHPEVRFIDITLLEYGKVYTKTDIINLMR